MEGVFQTTESLYENVFSMLSSSWNTKCCDSWTSAFYWVFTVRLEPSPAAVLTLQHLDSDSKHMSDGNL